MRERGGEWRRTEGLQVHEESHRVTVMGRVGVRVTVTVSIRGRRARIMMTSSRFAT